METIRVKTVDFSSTGDGNQDNFIVDLLRKRYHVVISDNPDFLIYSMWGDKHLEYDCTKIFYTGEPVSPDFNECDYAIGFDPLQFGARYLRLPLFAMEITPDIQDRSRFVDVSFSDKRFCNFIYSNEFTGEGAFLRKEFCKKLMQYKKVDCPGMVLHNMDTDELPSRWSRDSYWGKVNFIRNYKFTIAFENCLMDGYTTEKLVQPLIAGSIPIYYGNPLVAEEFNRDAFIDCNAFDNDFDAVVEKVRQIDNDPELAEYMVLQNPMRRDYDFAWEDKLLHFLTQIVESSRKKYTQAKQKKTTVDINRTNTLNYSIYREGILSSLKDWEEIVIYGKGNFARKIKEFLDAWDIQNVTACLVTKANDANGDFKGLPIVAIENWKPKTENPLILIAIRENNQEESIDSLSEMGYHSFLSINDFIMEVMKA